MNAFAITLLDTIIIHGNDLVQRNALIACRNELVCVPTSISEAPVAAQEVVESHEDSRPVADRDQRSIDYDALYTEGKGQYLLLDDEDEIEAGDEWIVKADRETNRARLWRSAGDFGKLAGEFTRSHYRRRI